MKNTSFLKLLFLGEQIDNAVFTVGALLDTLGIKLTQNALNKIKFHPEYPSLTSIADLLNDYGVENLSVKILTANLRDIPYPAVAHLQKEDGHFVMLAGLKNESVRYLDSEVGWIEETLLDFEKKWSGVVLLVETDRNSKEPNYKYAKQHELSQKRSQYVIWALLGSLIVGTGLFLPPVILSSYILNIFGTCVCILLFRSQFGFNNVLKTAFCNIGKKTNCGAVINTKYSKVFGFMHLSEIGCVYFSGGVILSLLSGLSGLNVLSILLLRSIITLPVIILSIWYQWKVIKLWCTMCLLVMLALALEFILLTVNFSPISFSLPALGLAVFCFCFPLMGWLALRPRYMDSFQKDDIERRLLKFTMNESIFKKLLESQPAIEIGDFKYELRTGVKDAHVTITIVISPFCVPCFLAFNVLQELFRLLKNRISIIYRFSVSPDAESSSLQVINHIAKTFVSSGNQAALTALSGWYISFKDDGNVNAWMSQFPVSQEIIKTDEVCDFVMEHASWSSKAEIYATPTIFINNKRMPKEFSVKDLPYQIRNLVKEL